MGTDTGKALSAMQCAQMFQNLLEDLRNHKPNDRSDRDRYWAIVITEVEKARAVFETYCR